MLETVLMTAFMNEDPEKRFPTDDRSGEPWIIDL
jgi:hypothetical protein